MLKLALLGDAVFHKGFSSETESASAGVAGLTFSRDGSDAPRGCGGTVAGAAGERFDLDFVTTASVHRRQWGGHCGRSSSGRTHKGDRMKRSAGTVALCSIVALAWFAACSAAAQALCGNGVVESGEACDQGPANGTAASCCTSGCAFRSAGMVCRTASTGETCDVAEVCTGSSATCPPDGVKPVGTVCRAASAGEACDVAETCDGTSKLCPADHFAHAGTVCRAASAGETCDATEVCTGSSPSCPPDNVKPAGTVCRAASAGQFCDVAETCNGIVKTCPADAFKSSSTVCRP